MNDGECPECLSFVVVIRGRGGWYHQTRLLGFVLDECRQHLWSMCLWMPKGGPFLLCSTVTPQWRG